MPERTPFSENHHINSINSLDGYDDYEYEEMGTAPSLRSDADAKAFVIPTDENEDKTEIAFLKNPTPDGFYDPPSGITKSIPTHLQGVGDGLDNILYREIGKSNTKAQIALDFCGFERCRPGHSFGPIARPVYIIHAVLEGAGSLRVEDKSYEVRQNQLFLLPPGIETFYSADNDDPWHYCWIGFHGAIAAKILKRIGLSKEHPVADFDGTELIENLIKNTMRYFELDIHDQLMRTGLLCTILAHMIEKSHPHEKASDLDAELSYDEYAVRYIQMYFQKKIRISDLADKIGISRSYLVKLMKEKIGMSPQEYLIKIRMEHAAHFLNHTNDSIRDVSMECGYDDALTFSRAFHQYFGISPTEFRTRLRNGAEEDRLNRPSKKKKASSL